MKPDLKDLKITERELERLSGFDVSDGFVGGILGGVYRPSVLRDRTRFFSVCLTEAIIAALVFVLALPFGLVTIRDSVAGVKDWTGIIQFVQIPFGIMLVVMLGWNLYMRFAVKRLRLLMNLLDDVDRYHQVLQAVEVMDSLEEIGPTLSAHDRRALVEALHVTRKSLVTGLKTERILRDSRDLLGRRSELLANLETNLVAVRSLEVSQIASDYGQLLSNALEISVRVHQDVQKFSR